MEKYNFTIIEDSAHVLGSIQVEKLDYFIKKRREYEKAEIGSYNSSEGLHITKEQVRTLLKENRLI